MDLKTCNNYFNCNNYLEFKNPMSRAPRAHLILICK